MKKTSLCFDARIEVKAADSEDARTRFRIVANTGSPMDVGFCHPVILQLDGVQANANHLPLRRNHDASRVVGHTETLNLDSENGLVAEGVLSFDNEDAHEIASSARNGFPWQASVGVSILESHDVKAGQDTEVNGKSFSGPLLVVEKSVVKEISFVDIGADANTSAEIAAQGDPIMLSDPVKNLLARLGIREDDEAAGAWASLSDEQAETIAASLPQQPDDGEADEVSRESEDEVVARHKRIRSMAAGTPVLERAAQEAILENLTYEEACDRLRAAWSEHLKSVGTPDATTDEGGSEDEIPDAKTLGAMVSNLSMI